VQYLGQPITEQKQVHQTAEEDHPQQHGLQRIAPAEQHSDRVASGEVEAFGSLPRCHVEALQQCDLAR
jgi:hypothetical protein